MRVGAPPLALALGALAFVLALLLWAAGATSGGFAVFLATLLSASVALGWIAVQVAKGKEPLRAARAVVLVLLSGFVPVLFDPHTGDVFNLPRYTLLVSGALVLAGLWILGAVHRRRLPLWRNGVEWLLGAVLLWTVITTFTAVDTHVSLLGNYGSYDGLYAALGFVTVAMIGAECFDAADIPKVLAGFALAAGSVVSVYGLIQLHDAEVQGSRWDFINWHTSSFSHEIFSTFGNPNHLGGYLAVCLPVIVVLGLQARRLLSRIAIAVLGLAMIVELLRTAARGAWVATIIAGVVLLVGFAPELRRRPLLVAGSSAVVVALAAVGMAAFGRRLIKEPLSQLFQSGGHTPVEQRFQIWSVAFHLATHHAFGVGPDNFALVYPQHQSASWVKALGPNYLVNGAHDILMNILADQGFIGLLLFVSLLFFLAVRGAGAWRRLRASERQGGDQALVDEARRDRWVLAATLAAAAGYLGQALFDVQQIGLTFLFWLLVGSVGVLTRSAGVPDTLGVAALLRAQPDWSLADLSSEIGAANPRYRSGRGRGRRRGPLPWLSGGAVVVIGTAVVLGIVGADGPYRADHAFWAANAAISSSGNQITNTYYADMQNAIVLNPWEPSYPISEGALLAGAASRTSSSATVHSALLEARARYQLALADEPLSATAANGVATVDQDLARVDPTHAQLYLAQGLKAAHQAVRDNPRDPQDQALLEQIQASLRTAK